MGKEVSMYNYKINPNIMTDVRIGNLIRLELGCGPKDKRIKGFYGLDIDASLEPDIVCNLEEGTIPLPSDTVKYIWADYVMEHLSNVLDIMQEIWRVCVNGALVYIGVPEYRWVGAAKDPTHKTQFCKDSYKYWDSRVNTVPHYGHTCKFDLLRLDIRYKEGITEEFKKMEDYYSNIIEKLNFYLQTIKE